MKVYIFLLITVGLVFACQQDEIYEGKVKEDFTKTIAQVSRERWMNLDKNDREQLYSTFSLEQKYAFWKQKIEKVLCLEWNFRELEHINKLNSFIDNNKSIFDLRLSELDDESTDSLRIFMYKWKKYAYNDLGWSKKLITNMLQSGYDLLDTDGNLVLNRSIVMSRLSDEDFPYKDCDCNGEYEPWLNYHYCAVWVACKVGNFCGDFFLYECDGLWMKRGG